MPANPGLTLVGFLQQRQAIEHLRKTCAVQDPGNDALAALWRQAQAKIGTKFVDAGHPEILDIPKDHDNYIAGVRNLDWADLPDGSEFKLVEIDPLLAFQFNIENGRSENHCSTLKSPPAVADLLPICLPLKARDEKIRITSTEQSMMVHAPTLNLMVKAAGQLPPDQDVIGIRFGVPLPFLHVVRFRGKCYLHNGFHRAYGCRKAGATHVPCLFREVNSYEAIGLYPDRTFSSADLEGENPPTLAHFTQGRAFEVQLKAMTRVLHVSWADYLITDEV